MTNARKLTQWLIAELGPKHQPCWKVAGLEKLEHVDVPIGVALVPRNCRCLRRLVVTVEHFPVQLGPIKRLRIRRALRRSILQRAVDATKGY